MANAETKVDLERCVHGGVAQGRAALAERFQAAQPFRHVVIDGFFDEDFCQRLVDSFPDFDEKLAINEDGKVGRKAVRERIRSIAPAWEALDELVKGEAFRELVGDITGIRDLQYDPYYFGGGTHDNRHGQDLDPHVDFNYHPVTRQHRRLNLIVYLNDEWRDDWGGSLQLHRDPYKPPAEDQIVTVTPIMNRCVIFETNEHSWHGFERIDLPEDRRQLSRRSFALYYYTDTRPADETGPEHSTIYVERHLPQRYRPGMTLEEGDLQELRLLLARRDQHLKRLYSNIKRLYTELNQLRDSSVSAETSADAPSGDVAELQAQVRRLRREVDELRASTSWRVTAPLRALKRMLGGGR